MLHHSEAGALTFDADGRATLEASIAFGFEEADELSAIIGRDLRGARVAPTQVSTPVGLEGDHAMAFGGDINEASRLLDFPELMGRRVEVTTWYQPRGNDVEISLMWVSGDFGGYLADTPSGNLKLLGLVGLTPTGRVTSDGWVELSSGPVDWALGGVIAPALSLVNPQHNIEYQHGSPAPTSWGVGQVHDSGAFALIDAFEIHDLGPASVPRAACTLPTEAETCGAEGLCFLGRCADASVVLGTTPRGQAREQFLDRQMERLRLFTAVRKSRAQMGEALARLDALRGASSAAFWPGVSAAYELLGDGLGAPAQTAGFRVDNTLSTCMGPGLADLLPGPRREVEPMVFNSDFEELQPGDVLVRIDGLAVTDWLADASRLFYFNGDPGARKLSVMADVLDAAQLTGATVEFERCPRSSAAADKPCTAAEVETITVDLASSIGDAYWSGEIPDRLVSPRLCDLRFAPASPSPQEKLSFYYFAAEADVDGVRHVIFNAFPTHYLSGGEEWQETMSFVTRDPPMLLIDQRTGMGGMADTAAILTGDLLAQSNESVALSYPWFPAPLDVDIQGAFAQCQTGDEWPYGEDSFCGFYRRHTPRGLGSWSSSRVALVNGRAKSGHDIFTRFMTTRSASTRIFGYAPTHGAFGTRCRLPRLLPGMMTPASFQCHDTIFLKPDGSDQGFESGRGIAADEYVFQTMSDALRGEDSILEAAEAWLRQGGDQ